MGCDIHIYLETKKGDKWEFHPSQEFFIEVEEYDSKKYEYPNVKSSLPDDRSYNTFAILADVRNGRGFAGIRTGDGFEPLSEPRGIPGNCSEQYKKIVDQWNGDGHSHSFLTLKELKATPEYWNKTTRFQGGEKEYTYKEVCYVDEIIKDIEKRTKDSGLSDDEIRVVFFFDN